MGKKIQSKANLARLMVEKFPHTSKIELARMLFKKYPLQFSSVDDARGSVRGVTGAKGNKLSASATHVEVYKGRLNIPDGDIADWTPYILKSKKVGILSDIHIPFQDNKALTTALEKCFDEKVDTILLNGDTMDFYKCSRWAKNPSKKNIVDEFRLTATFINDLKLWFPKCKIVFKYGNHDDRLELFIQQKAPELWGIEVFELGKLLDYIYEQMYNEKSGVEYVKNKRVIQLGSLNILHGHEYVQSSFSPVNPARGLFIRAKTNVIAGHNHQTSSHIESDLTGKSIGAWSTGCLCDLHPDYMPLNKWNHGFAIVTAIGDKGNFQVKNYNIFNGEIL